MSDEELLAHEVKYEDIFKILIERCGHEFQDSEYNSFADFPGGVPRPRQAKNPRRDRRGAPGQKVG